LMVRLALRLRATSREGQVSQPGFTGESMRLIRWTIWTSISALAATGLSAQEAYVPTADNLAALRISESGYGNLTLRSVARAPRGS
jgi:hypothetical protein